MASARSIKAGSAFVEFFLEDGRLQRGLKKTEAKLRQFGTKLRNVGAGFLKFGLAGLSALAFPFAKLAQFDDAIRAVGAVTRATDAELKSMENRAKELGKTTSFAAVEVAGLMTELGRAGFKPEQINRMTAAVMNLARATGTDAALSAGIMSATIRQFNLDATDAARIANVLTVAANSTFNTVEGLGQSLAYAGPVASSLGMSLEDTVAILGTLGDVGIQGSAAGTALKRLATLSAAEAGKMNRVFGVAFADAAGNARPLIDVLGEVAAVTNDLPTAERFKKFNDAFGLLGITGAVAIGGAASKTKELSEALKNVTTEAADAAAAMDAGPGGMLRRLSSAFEGFQLSVGKAIEGVVSKFGGELTQTLGSLTTFIDTNKHLVETFLKVSVAAAVSGAAIVTLGGTIQAVAFGVGGLSTAISVTVKAFGLMKAASIAASSTLITTAIPNVIAYTSVVGAARIATFALKAGLVGLAAYGIYVVSKAIYNANSDLKSFNDELKKMQLLTSKLEGRKERQRQKVLSVAGQLDGERKAGFLQAQLNRAKKELAGAKASLKGQEKVVDNLNTPFNEMTGNKILESERVVLDDQSRRVEGLDGFVEELEAALTDVNFEVSVNDQREARVETLAAAEKMSGGERESFLKAEQDRVRKEIGESEKALVEINDGGSTADASLQKQNIDELKTYLGRLENTGESGKFDDIANRLSGMFPEPDEIEQAMQAGMFASGGFLGGIGVAAKQDDGKGTTFEYKAAFDAAFGDALTVDAETLKLSADIGAQFGFGGLGSLAANAAVITADATEPEESDTSEFFKNLEAGAQSVVNSATDANSSEGQDAVTKALSGIRPAKDEVETAVAKMNKELLAEAEKQTALEKKAPSLKVAKT